MAAYAARGNMNSLVLIPDGKISWGKLSQSLDYGALTCQLRTDFDGCVRILNELVRQKPVYLLNSVNPYRIEGQKTAAVELMEQLAWEPPDHIIVPGGNLGNSSAIGKALLEMLELKLISRLPKLSIIQAHGANPFYRSFRENFAQRHRVSPETIASAIRIAKRRTSTLVARSPETTVVINCAGRTRSIIGAQSLINAGLPNKVVALRNGTMGWQLAGFSCDSGKNRRATDVSASGLAWARSAAGRVASRFGVERIDAATLQNWRQDRERTLYLFDVRDPDEYRAGHVPGAVSAPGGQLVQATDQYVGTLGARIVLVDDAEVRALMTASWLRQMGFREVFVLAERGDETGFPKPPVLGFAPRPDLEMKPAELDALLKREAATAIDLSLSREYRRAHIRGAWFAIRSRLARALAVVALRDRLVLTSEDGILAGLAVPELSALTDRPVRYLAGGNAAWSAAGFPLVSGEDRMADEAIDVWLRPYEQPRAAEAAMREYLTWETDLLPRIERDGTARFGGSG